MGNCSTCWVAVLCGFAIAFFGISIWIHGWPNGNFWTMISAIGSVATCAGVFLAAWQMVLARRERKIARKLKEWVQIVDTEQLLIRIQKFCDGISLESRDSLKERCQEISRDYEGLRLAVSGQPGAAFMVNLSDVIWQINQINIVQYQGIDDQRNLLSSIKSKSEILQQNLRDWTHQVKSELNRLGEPVPGWNE